MNLFCNGYKYAHSGDDVVILQASNEQDVFEKDYGTMNHNVMVTIIRQVGQM